MEEPGVTLSGAKARAICTVHTFSTAVTHGAWGEAVHLLLFLFSGSSCQNVFRDFYELTFEPSLELFLSKRVQEIEHRGEPRSPLPWLHVTVVGGTGSAIVADLPPQATAFHMPPSLS